MKTPAEVGCDCANCPFASKGKHQADFVPVEGPPDPVGVVWCDVPTHDDARSRSPMSRHSILGKEWGRILASAGLERETLLHVPATACKRPSSVKESKTPKAVEACKPWRQIPTGLPQLALGKFAWQGATGLQKGFKFHRGFVKDGLVTTHRPESALFWNTKESEAFWVDVQRFGRAVAGKLHPAPTIKIDEDGLSACLRTVYERKWVAFDIETMPVGKDEPWTGKDPTRARLRTISLGWEDVGYAFLWAALSPTGQEAVRAALQNPDVVKVGMNIVWFDNRVLERYGIAVTNFIDCRDLRRAMSSTSRLSLAYQTALCTDAPPWKSHKDEEAEDAGK